jgi:anti-anti-sigma factor
MLQSCEPREELVIRFKGRLDSAKCAEIETEVRRTLAMASKALAFDLEEVDFVSSAFLRLCICGQQQAGSLGFRVINVAPYVKRVFKIAGLDAMLKAD